VDGVNSFTLVLVSVIRSVTVMLLALLQTSPPMEQVTRGSVVEQENISRVVFGHITIELKQLMATMLMAY